MAATTKMAAPDIVARRPLHPAQARAGANCPYFNRSAMLHKKFADWRPLITFLEQCRRIRARAGRFGRAGPVAPRLQCGR